MKDALVIFFLLSGASFALIAAVGIVRMPDLFTRLQASAKATTLGTGCIMIAVAIHFQDVAVTTKVFLITAFLFITAPIAAHMIARAGYFSGTPLWKGAVLDELRHRYDPQTHKLRSGNDSE